MGRFRIVQIPQPNTQHNPGQRSDFSDDSPENTSNEKENDGGYDDNVEDIHGDF